MYLYKIVESKMGYNIQENILFTETEEETALSILNTLSLDTKVKQIGEKICKRIPSPHMPTFDEDEGSLSLGAASNVRIYISISGLILLTSPLRHKECQYNQLNYKADGKYYAPDWEDQLMNFVNGCFLETLEESTKYYAN